VPRPRVDAALLDEVAESRLVTPVRHVFFFFFSEFVEKVRTYPLAYALFWSAGKRTILNVQHIQAVPPNLLLLDSPQILESSTFLGSWPVETETDCKRYLQII
jgi:hypothetical protein